MKKLDKIFESLLDADFDIDYDISPIKIVEPFCDSEGNWKRCVKSLNDSLEIAQYAPEINTILKKICSLSGKIGPNDQPHQRLKKWIHDGALLKPIDIDDYAKNPTIKAARILNDWIAKANKFREIEKLISALGYQFDSWIGAMPTKSGILYGYLAWMITSPNELARKKLEDAVVKLNKIDPLVEVEFKMLRDGDATINARLTKVPK